MNDFVKGNIKLINADCMDIMKNYPDNYFDLAAVDPPYGIKDKIISGGETNHKIKLQKGLEKFNDKVPSKQYFKELKRISVNQIIWGGNYFVEFLSHSRGWIVWDKKIPDGMSYSKAELAYSSFNRNLEIFRPKKEIKSIHPTQKPVKLYQWLLENYSEHNQKILDTHLGSGSSAIAAHYFGCEFVGIELDKEYFDDSIKRFKEQTMQQKLF